MRASNDEDGQIVHDDQEMIIGMVPRGDLNIFFDDLKGFNRLADYIKKLIDNFYKVSKQEYTKKKLFRVISKLIMRRKIKKRLENSMPVYCERLHEWENSVLDRHNIDKGQLDGEIEV